MTRIVMAFCMLGMAAPTSSPTPLPNSVSRQRLKSHKKNAPACTVKPTCTYNQAMRERACVRACNERERTRTIQ
jgi:hypothetical protein